MMIAPRFVLFGAACAVWLTAMTIWTNAALQAAGRAWFTLWGIQILVTLWSWVRPFPAAVRAPSTPDRLGLSHLPGLDRFGQLAARIHPLQFRARTPLEAEACMANAEATHTVTLLVVTMYAGVVGTWRSVSLAIFLAVWNVVFNLYPIALQRRNRARVSRIMTWQASRPAAQHHHRDAREVNRFDGLGRQLAVPEKLPQVQMPVNAGQKGRQMSGHAVDSVGGTFQPSEVVEEHEAPARSADAHHLARGAHGIRHDVDHVRGVHRVEAAIGERQVGGIHLAQRDLGHPSLRQTGSREPDHLRRQIDGDDAAVAPVAGETNTGAHANLKNRFSCGGREASHGAAPPGLQRRTVKQIVKEGEAAIDDVRRRHVGSGIRAARTLQR
jgi:hypothetical protein